MADANQSTSDQTTGQSTPDPLEGLVERTKADVGAAFADEVIAALIALKHKDRGAFVRLRQQLKKETEVSVTALDQAMREDSGEDDGGEKSQADVLLRIAQESEPFHTSNGEAYADITKGDAGGSSHRETWMQIPIHRGQSFRRIADSIPVIADSF
jgi:hypothetical protein